MRRPQSEPESPLSVETTLFLRKHCPLRGRRATPQEAAYLEALEALTPDERRRLRDLPWTKAEGRQEELLPYYEAAIAWRIEQVVQKGVHPRNLLRRLEKHWGRRSLLDALPD